MNACLSLYWRKMRISTNFYKVQNGDILILEFILLWVYNSFSFIGGNTAIKRKILKSPICSSFGTVYIGNFQNNELVYLSPSVSHVYLFFFTPSFSFLGPQEDRTRISNNFDILIYSTVCTESQNNNLYYDQQYDYCQAYFLPQFFLSFCVYLMWNM